MCNQLNGIIVLDKPAGISSAKAVARLKKELAVVKVGHCGTLDPFATGILVCCINQATRLTRFFLHSDKTYEAVLRLGVETDTQDASGKVIAQADLPKLGDKQLQTVFKQFQGHQMQHPPVFAALKHKGTPLYKLARQGKPVQKPPRPITIKALTVLDVNLPDIRFTVTCSAGTYVRTLCADMGCAIGCGGHLLELRRTASSGFSLQDVVTLATFKKMDCDQQRQQLIPMADALRHMPVWQADAQLLKHIAHGRPLTQQQSYDTGVPIPDSITSRFLKVVDQGNNLRAVLESTQNRTGYNYCCVFNEYIAESLKKE